MHLPAAHPISSASGASRRFLTRELAALTGVSDRTIRRRIQAEGLPYEEVTVRGGRTPSILFTDLPDDLRSAVVRQLPELAPTLSALLAEAPAVTQNMPEWQRTAVSAWLDILQRTWGMRGRELMRALVDLEAVHPGVDMSYPTYRRKLQAFLRDGARGLAPAWGKGGKTPKAEKWLRVFASYYLFEGGPAIRDAHRKAYGHAVRQEPGLTLEAFGGHHAFKRLLDRAVSPSAQYFYRAGVEAWTRKYKSHVSRDPSAVETGELWVSDHHQLDVGCTWDTVLSCIPGIDGEIKGFLSQTNGKPKPVFPWITVWRDFRSGKILSCLIHDDAPNSDHVIYSFYLACKRFGVPKAILLDNGKDYRCRAFAGGRDRAVKVDLSERDRSICRLLGVLIHYAIPYNAKAKPIERDFRKFKEWLCLYLVGYRGGNHTERPERLIEEIKAGKLLGHEELAASVHTFVEQVMNRFPSQGKYLQGKSPDEHWDTTPKAVRHVAADELALCCMRATEPRQIGGQGVHYAPLKLDYYADWMSTQGGRKVYLRLDLLHFSEAFVFDAETDICLGRAKANAWQADALVKDETAGARLKALARMQARQLKDLKSIGESLGLGVEHLEPVKDAAAALAALGQARGYVPALPAPEAVPEVPKETLTTTLSGVVVENRTARARKGQKTLPVPQKRKYTLFDSERETDIDAGESGAPELKRAAG